MARMELTPYPARRARKRRPPSKFLVNDRRRQGTLLRIAGANCEEIGLALHADASVNVRGISVEGGYGWRNLLNGLEPPLGKRLASLVSADLSKGWDEVQVGLEEARAEWRAIELARLDAAQKAIWQRVEQGNDWAIDRFLGIVDRRMRLLGLEAPMQVETKSQVTIEAAIGRQPDVTPEFTSGVQEALAELQTALRPERDIVDAEVVEVESA